MFLMAFVGAIIAGAYGILHDQITFTIGPEYFSKFKFEQFRYADFGWGDRVFVGCIGFLATWWVGFVFAWFFARRHFPDQRRDVACRAILKSFVVVWLCGVLAGVIGYVYGLWLGPDADYSSWRIPLLQFDVIDSWSFIRVAYIHNASYLGGLVGFVVALIFIRPNLIKPNCNGSKGTGLEAASDVSPNDRKTA